MLITANNTLILLLSIRQVDKPRNKYYMPRLQTQKSWRKQREKNLQLLRASKNGNAEEIISLLNDGADIEVRNDEEEDIEFLTRLQNIKTRNHTFLGETPLVLAASFGHPTCVSILLARGADFLSEHSTPNGYLIPGYYLYQSALHAACQKGHPECVSLLLEACADTRAGLEAQREDGATPLFVAAEYGNTECVKLLLEKGAKIHATLHQCRGSTTYYVGAEPIYFAAKNGHTECVKLLLEAGASIEFRLETGYVLFHRTLYTTHCCCG